MTERSSRMQIFRWTNIADCKEGDSDNSEIPDKILEITWLRRYLNITNTVKTFYYTVE